MTDFFFVVIIVCSLKCVSEYGVFRSNVPKHWKFDGFLGIKNSIVFRDRRLNVACPFLHHVLSSCGVFGSGFNPSGYCLLVLNSQIVRVYFGKCFFSFGGGGRGVGVARTNFCDFAIFGLGN